MAPVVYAPAFTWTGFYIGVNGGFADRVTSGSTNFGSSTGGTIGVTGGYNYQIGQFVAGFEGDVNWLDTSKSAAYINGTNKFSTNTMITDRLRAGYAIDRTLLFVTGGYAGMQTRASFNDTVFGFSGSQSGWRSGGVLGGGVEYAFTNNITAKAEYLWAPMGGKTYFSGTPDVEKNNIDLSLFRVGRELQVLISRGSGNIGPGGHSAGLFLSPAQPSEPRRLESGDVRRERLEPGDELGMFGAPRALEPQIEIAERASEARSRRRRARTTTAGPPRRRASARSIFPA